MPTSPSEPMRLLKVTQAGQCAASRKPDSGRRSSSRIILGIAVKVGSHFQGFPKLVDPHPDQEDDEIALDLGGDPLRQDLCRGTPLCLDCAPIIRRCIECSPPTVTESMGVNTDNGTA
jgi:hypothetical protein